jgi:hypothetical protein
MLPGITDSGSADQANRRMSMWSSIYYKLATKERQNSRNDSDLDNEETDGERNRKEKNEVK